MSSGPPPDANGIDNPTPLALGAIQKLALEENEDYYLRLTAPAGTVRIVQDMRLSGEAGILQSVLSLLDQHGGVIESNVLRFNEVDVASRKTATIALKQPTVILRVLNTSGPVDIWLAVLAEDAPSFIPLFGSLVPRPMSPGPGASGELEPRQSVYYAHRFAAGAYRVIVDFTNLKNSVSNLQGQLSMLEADGGNEQTVVRFNEIDITNRKVEKFSLRKEEPRILRVHNTGAPIRYSIRIERIE